jgi:citrate lyase subunit beta/citryl-CoA lyase
MSGRLTWQSLLFLPAGDGRLLASAIWRRPDAVILDLEDAIDPAARPAARAAIAEGQRTLRAAGIGCAVRINTPLRDMPADIAALDLGALDALVVPKCDDPRPLLNVDELTGGGIPLIGLVESPVGLRHLHAIADLPQVAGLMLGSEDFSATLGIDPNGGGLVHPVTQIALAAAGRGLMAVGFPGSIANFRDLDLYGRQIAQGRTLGMTAVAAIHPAQLPVIAAAFTPTEAELDWARRIMARAGDMQVRGEGVAAQDGQMIDAPVIARAARILSGKPSPSPDT